MKLFIPSIGSRFRLVSDAKVKVHFELRNSDFLKRLGVDYYCPGKAPKPDKALTEKYGVEVDLDYATVTIPKGVELGVSRIYIRNGVSDYDSVTFNLIKNKVFPHGRFWLKLEDVNRLDVEVAIDKTEQRKEEKEGNKKEFLACLSESEQEIVQDIEKMLPIYRRLAANGLIGTLRINQTSIEVATNPENFSCKDILLAHKFIKNSIMDVIRTDKIDDFEKLANIALEKHDKEA